MINSKKLFTLLITLALAVVILGPGTAFGAGFALTEQSVAGLGNAHAGGAAVAENASTIFFNPAGLTRLKGNELILNTHVIRPRIKYQDDGSTHATGAPLDVNNDNGGEIGSTDLIPNGYYSFTSENGLAFGIGVHAPYGLSIDYNDEWVGRYYSQEMKLKTININPTVAYRVSDQLSLGLGLSAQNYDAKMSNAVDFGGLAFELSGYNPALAPLIQQRDGKVALDGDDWGYGFNAGLLYEVNDNTRVGLSYRSRIKHEVKGNAKFTIPAVISGDPVLDGTIAAVFADAHVTADVTTPDSASLSVYHRLDPRLALMADVTWTNWSLLDELKVKMDNAYGESVTTYGWEDAWRIALGATYNPTPDWPLRFGVAYDQTPVPSSSVRIPAVPDQDRYWVTLGTGYRLNDRVKFDIAYAHLFVKDTDINKSVLEPENVSRGNLRGSYDISADAISVGMTVNW